MLNFAFLPPEINSERMYTGVGSGPWLVASNFWDLLAEELRSMHAVYETNLNDLYACWHGPSARNMIDATTPYLQWLAQTSHNAEQTAIQLRSAVRAYETAFAMTVPPPIITSNRIQLAILIATNFFGQNNGAIAELEMQYCHMWVQDSAAMFLYSHSARMARRLLPFQPPPQTTSRSQQSVVLISPEERIKTWDAVKEIFFQPDSFMNVTGFISDLMGTFGYDIVSTFGFGLVGLDEEITEELVPLEILETIEPFGSWVSSISPVSAHIGQASLIGELSVPALWITPESVVLTSAIEPIPELAIATISESTIEASVFPLAEMASAGIVGSSGMVPKEVYQSNDQDIQDLSDDNLVSSLGDPLPELSPESPCGMLMGADIELHELAQLYRDGILTREEYLQQRYRLVHR